MTRYELRSNQELGRYLVAAKDLKAGEVILSDPPFVLGPYGDSGLLCFNCYLPIISKFVACKVCALAPVCPGDGCSEHLAKWHTKQECEFFSKCKQARGINPLTMVQNVGSLIVLRAFMKKAENPQAWNDFLCLESHLEKRRGTDIWEFCETTVQFLDSLGLLESDVDKELIQKMCGAIDVNSFEVRGPAIPAINCAEILRGVYMKAALIAHDCLGNTHISVADNNMLVCHASADIKKGDILYYNYTDALKGTVLRKTQLLIGKYFECTCQRCKDPTELGTFISSLKCSLCKTGYVSLQNDKWSCQSCAFEFDSKDMSYKVQCCADKLNVINKKDEKQLEEYIRNVSLILAPNHYLLLDAKQRLAGVLRDAINKALHPTKTLIKRKIELCQEIMPVLEKLCPGYSRIKAITLYELHSSLVLLAKKNFDAREITGSVYLDELISAEKLLKSALEMLFIEPGNSLEGELCAKAIEEYRTLKSTMGTVLDGIHAEGKTYVEDTEADYLHPTM